MHSVTPYAFTSLSTSGNHARARLAGVGSPPRATTRRLILVSISFWVVSIVDSVDGVVSTCVAPLTARHAASDANKCDLGAIAATHPAAHALMKSPSEGSKECGDATRTTQFSSTSSDSFLPAQYSASPPCVARQPFGRPVLPDVKKTCDSLSSGNAGGGATDRSFDSAASVSMISSDASMTLTLFALMANVIAIFSRPNAFPSPARGHAITTEHSASSRMLLIRAGGSWAPTGTTAACARRIARMDTGNSIPSSTSSPTVGDRP